jgi:NTP pyrophosphatase (non-canonical NTP hydrolase)
MKELVQMVRDFVADRPVMAENNADPKRIMELMFDEMRELEVEVLKGDIKAASHEMPDVLWMLISLSNLLGVDLEAEFRTKGARNHLKRPASEWQTGTYQECDQRCRSNWTKEDELDFYS